MKRAIIRGRNGSKHRCNGLHNGSLDRCKYIRTRSDKVEVFQFTLTVRTDRFWFVWLALEAPQLHQNTSFTVKCLPCTYQDFERFGGGF